MKSTLLDNSANIDSNRALIFAFKTDKENTKVQERLSKKTYGQDFVWSFVGTEST